MKRLTNHAAAIASVAVARSMEPPLATCQSAANIRKIDMYGLIIIV
jgi:hypothetical protein